MSQRPQKAEQQDREDTNFKVLEVWRVEARDKGHGEKITPTPWNSKMKINTATSRAKKESARQRDMMAGVYFPITDEQIPASAASPWSSRGLAKPSGCCVSQPCFKETAQAKSCSWSTVPSSNPKDPPYRTCWMSETWSKIPRSWANLLRVSEAKDAGCAGQSKALEQDTLGFQGMLKLNHTMIVEHLTVALFLVFLGNKECSLKTHMENTEWRQKCTEHIEYIWHKGPLVFGLLELICCTLNLR